MSEPIVRGPIRSNEWHQVCNSFVHKRVRPVLDHVKTHAELQLSLVVYADCGFCFELRSVQRRKKHRRQNRNDGNDHQKFNESERSSSIVLQTVAFATRFSSVSGELHFHWRSTETINRSGRDVDGCDALFRRTFGLTGCEALTSGM